jgi:DNA-binding transcriptional LysR family regulator
LLKLLEYFRSVARGGSLTAAARELGVSQPTLSVAMRKLEERLQTTLMLRDRDGVRLTETGQVLLDHTQEIFTILDHAQECIIGLEREDAGSFTIGCHESLGAYFLPALLNEFMTAAPNIELSLRNATSAEVQQAVINREIHFGLVVNPLPHPDLVIVETCEDAVDLFVAVPPGHDACGPAPCATESLDEAVALLRKGPLVFAGRVGQSHALIDRLAAQGWLPVRRLACGDLELVKSLTAGGLGVGILPRRVAGYGQRGRLMRLHAEMPSFPDTICLIYRSDMHRTRAAMRVKDALVAHGRSLGPSVDASRTLAG